MAGMAAAAGSALAGSAEAEVVQITLNETVTFQDISLDTDFTGDGIAENFFVQRINTDTGGTTTIQRRGVRVSGTGGVLGSAYARRELDGSTMTSFVVELSGTRYADSVPEFVNRFVSFRFTDARINGGEETRGVFYMEASNSAFTEHEILIARLIFDDADPEGNFDVNQAITYPEWVDPVPALRAALKSKIRKLKKKIAKAKKSGKKAKVKRFTKKLKKLKMELAGL